MPGNDRPLNANEKNKRNWLPIGISVISLLISLLTAANALMPRDDIRLMVDQPPFVYLDDADFSIWGIRTEQADRDSSKQLAEPVSPRS
jgi:hypothetical protein